MTASGPERTWARQDTLPTKPCHMGARAWCPGSSLRGPRQQPAAANHTARATNRAVQLLLGHTKVESTVRYLGVEVDDALAIAEQIDI